MTGQFHHVPLDDPYLDRYEEAHAIDSDPQSTTMAIGIVKDAVACRASRRQRRGGQGSDWRICGRGGPGDDEALH